MKQNGFFLFTLRSHRAYRFDIKNYVSYVTYYMLAFLNKGDYICLVLLNVTP